MIIRTEYAVRVKGTQKYLPRPQRRDGRGGSHLDPIDFANPQSWPDRYSRDMQIRSYTTERAAKNLLAAWLQGAVHCSRSGGTAPFYDDYEEVNHLERKPERRAEDMEIVKITIHLPA